MPSPISTHDELRSSRRRLRGHIWRVVEAQHQISTAKLTDSADEQKLLEDVIENTKPAVPEEYRHLHFLLSTPFRYGAPYPRGSRFRRAGRTPGVFYGSENVDTEIAEICFGRLLFFAESPDTKWPREAGEYTAFAADYLTANAIDLTKAPFSDRMQSWGHLTRYDECQALAELARTADIDLIRYASARDPAHKSNLAILHCRAFIRADLLAERQTWRILLGSNGARAFCEMPRVWIDFDRDSFLPDPRIASMRWDR